MYKQESMTLSQRMARVAARAHARAEEQSVAAELAEIAHTIEFAEAHVDAGVFFNTSSMSIMSRGTHRRREGRYSELRVAIARALREEAQRLLQEED